MSMRSWAMETTMEIGSLQRTEFTTAVDRCGYPAPTSRVTRIELHITGTAWRELVQITPLAMLDKLAASSGMIRGQPTCWAVMEFSNIPESVRVGPSAKVLLLWPRPEQEYRVRIATEGDPER